MAYSVSTSSDSTLAEVAAAHVFELELGYCQMGDGGVHLSIGYLAALWDEATIHRLGECIRSVAFMSSPAIPMRGSWR